MDLLWETLEGVSLQCVTTASRRCKNIAAARKNVTPNPSASFFTRSARKDVKRVAHLQRFSSVILSAADTSQSEVFAESKDPYPSAAAPERKGILTARPHPRGCVWDFGRTQEAAIYILRRDRLPIRSNRTSTTQHVNRALAG